MINIFSRYIKNCDLLLLPVWIEQCKLKLVFKTLINSSTSDFVKLFTNNLIPEPVQPPFDIIQ